MITQGNWYVSKCKYGSMDDGNIDIREGEDSIILCGTFIHGDKVEKQDNARVMAAAPKLLAACEDMQKLFFMCGSDVHAAGGVVRAINEANEQAKAAIKAAKGE